jgi:hypothetical protein
MIFLYTISINQWPNRNIQNQNPHTTKKMTKSGVSLHILATYHISKIFRHTHLRVAFKTKNSLQPLLNARNKSVDNFQESGVYQLTCKNNGKKYTGQTGRNFEKGFKEHFHSFKYNNYKSKFAQHLLETGHEFGKIDDTMSILYYKKKVKHVDTMEKFYIYRETKDNNQLNDKHTVIYNSIFETIIEKEMNID